MKPVNEATITFRNREGKTTITAYDDLRFEEGMAIFVFVNLQRVIMYPLDVIHEIDAHGAEE